ncbi:anti-anti-sigma regulatory factor [Pedobacter sp. UYP30]|uniref:STAS domain-containing protein n=1 Tax=Pedobacter sp. UYP30 TaxID=1756400 RepID=UPI0033953AB2
MKFSVDKQEKYVVLELQEERFTNEVAPGLKSELYMLNAEGFKHIVLNLASVAECKDAQDLSSLLVGDRLCKSLGGLFVVAGVTSELESIIALSNIFNSIVFVNNVEEAVDFIFMDDLENELKSEN